MSWGWLLIILLAGWFMGSATVTYPSQDMLDDLERKRDQLQEKLAQLTQKAGK